jgi:hypothetical protein
LEERIMAGLLFAKSALVIQTHNLNALIREIETDIRDIDDGIRRTIKEITGIHHKNITLYSVSNLPYNVVYQLVIALGIDIDLTKASWDTPGTKEIVHGILAPFKDPE